VNHNPTTVALDAHVHFYAQTPLLEALHAATANFASSRNSDAGVGMLMLSESHGHDAFSRLRSHADVGTGGLRHCLEPEVVDMSIGSWRLLIVAGRQVVTQERVEVLTLGTLTQIPDGRSLKATLAEAEDIGAIVVLPWGVGKWLGRRRASIVEALATTKDAQLHLGDIAGRPRLWRDSLLSKPGKGSSCALGGTDPYPLPNAWRRIGSFGSVLSIDLENDRPLASLKRALAKPFTEAMPFGRRVTTPQFIKEQVALRLRVRTKP
jgi:hypothetical protein